MAVQDDTPLPLITVIIPVFNEEKNIDIAYKAVTHQFEQMKHRYRLELLFSDNHSTDGTLDELKKLATSDKRVKVLRLARNFGFQRSVLTAFRHASGDAAIQLDCDLQDPPELLPALLDKWDAGHDVVVGIRRNRQEAFLLQLARRLFYKLVTAISDDNIIENAGDFRLVDRSVINRLRNIHDARPYTRGLVSALAARQVGIEYDRQSRKFEQSKFPLRRLTGFAADGIINHSLIPLRLATLFGFVVSGIALSIALYYTFAYFISGKDWPEGFATLTILLLISVGLNAIFIGIVGEYVGRIFDQVRMRPITVIDFTINLEPNHSQAPLTQEGSNK